jgi:hypothetical protein
LPFFLPWGMSLKVYPVKKKVKINQFKVLLKAMEVHEALVEVIVDERFKAELEPQKYSWEIGKTN